MRAFRKTAEQLAAAVGAALGRGIQHESGQGLSEYALILLLIAIVAIAALTFLGSDISSILSNVATQL